MITMIASDVLQPSADSAELDAQIVAAFAQDATSSDAARLLAEVKEATSAAELATETARKHALDPLLSGDDLKLARREMDDAAFKQDRLHEASAKLTERVEALKALEADRRLQAEHERVLAERDRLAEEMERMAEPIVKIAHTVSRIAICDREIGRLNAISAAKFGHIRMVLSGAAPRYLGSVSGRRGLGRFHCGRRAASGFRRGRREGPTARQAIRQFAGGVLAEVERGAERHPGMSDSMLWWSRLRPVRRVANDPRGPVADGGTQRQADAAIRCFGRRSYAELQTFMQRRWPSTLRRWRSGRTTRSACR
jgi:hypothetical protein